VNLGGSPAPHGPTEPTVRLHKPANPIAKGGVIRVPHIVHHTVEGRPAHPLRLVDIAVVSLLRPIAVRSCSPGSPTEHRGSCAGIDTEADGTDSSESWWRSEAGKVSRLDGYRRIVPTTASHRSAERFGKDRTCLALGASGPRSHRENQRSRLRARNGHLAAFSLSTGIAGVSLPHAPLFLGFVEASRHCSPA
jgi:hypothetical protein